MKKHLFVLFIFISGAAFSQDYFPQMIDFQKDFYNALGGENWEFTLQDGTKVKATENWGKELENKRTFWGRKFDIYDVIDKFDLANGNLSGDMPEYMFTMSWEKYSKDIPELYHNSLNNARNQNEDNLDLVSFQHPSHHYEWILSYNKITSLSRDITASATTCPEVFKIDHNELTEFPDFAFTKTTGSGGTYSSTGFLVADFSQNNISNVDQEKFKATNQAAFSEVRSCFSMTGLDLDISNNRMNFNDVLAIKELAEHLTHQQHHAYLKKFTYAPQRPLGEGSENTYTEGSSVTLEFTLPHEDNKYEWYLNGKTTGITGQTLNIKSLSVDEAGVYVCKVTNSKVPSLALESAPMMVFLEKSGNTPPSDIAISSTSAISTVPAFALNIGDLSATDSDGDDVHFMLKEGGFNYSFRIVDDKTLVNAEDLFDHYTIQSYDITVIAYDVYGGRTEKVITINHDKDLEALFEDLYKTSLGETYKDYCFDIYLETIIKDVKTVPEGKKDPFNVCNLDFVLKYKDDKHNKREKAVKNAKFYLENAYDNKYFKINNKSINAVEEFNFEEKSKYKIQVTFAYEKDGKAIKFKKFLDVNVTDVKEAPVGITLTNTRLPINSPVGTLLGYASCVQEDAEPVPTTLSCISEEFIMSGNSVKTLAKFKTPGTTELTLKVVDELENEYFQAFTISFYDPEVNGAPVKVYIDNTTISTDASSGGLIGNLFTEDPDKDDIFTYTIDDDRFEIKGSKLYYKQGALGDENVVNITSTDKNGEQVSAQFTLHKSGNFVTPSTVIGLSSFFIEKSWPVDTQIAVVLSDALGKPKFKLFPHKDADYFKIEDNILSLKKLPHPEKDVYNITIKDGELLCDLKLLVVEDGFSVDERVLSSDMIFPNPAVDYVTINIDGASYVEVADLTGKIVISKELSSRGNIDVESLKPGLYMFKIVHEDKTSLIKVIKK
ncbi:MAG: T9SS type A sorting domain-containing protein [Hyphomicrobiales bacterium]